MFEGGRKVASEMKTVGLIFAFVLAITGCADGSANLACSGTNVVTEVRNGNFFETQVPLVISLQISAVKSLNPFGEKSYEARVNYQTFAKDDIITIKREINGFKEFDSDTGVSFRFNLDTKVLSIYRKKTIRQQNVKYSAPEEFTGKCS